MSLNPSESDHETSMPDISAARGWERLTRFLAYYRHIVGAVVIALSLGVFLALLPDYIRAALVRGLQIQPYLTGLLFGFSLLALSLLWSTGQRIDAWAFLHFNLKGTRPLWLDWLMLAITQLGDGFFALGLALLVFFFSERRLAYEIGLGTLTLWLCVELIKAIVRRSRPFVRLTQTRIVGYRAGGRSFPSGHTSQAFFLATLLAQHYHLNLWLAGLLLLSAGLIGLTRMYVGAHYPRDVLAGAILGSVWGLLGTIVDVHFFG